MDYSSCGLKESDMIERLTLSLSDTCNYLLLHHLHSLSSPPKGISFAKTLSCFFFFFPRVLIHPLMGEMRQGFDLKGQTLS